MRQQRPIVEELSAANASLFGTMARLLDAADDLKRDRKRLLGLLRQANPDSLPQTTEQPDPETETA